MNLLQSWLGRLAYSIGQWFDPPYQTIIVQEGLPTRLEKRTLYIVQDNGYFEQAALMCPCGCKKTLQMNLLQDTRPCWTATLHANGTATLQPSVWRQIDCQSHFLFRRGRVEWHRAARSSEA